jgi:hypothetical protein
MAVTGKLINRLEGLALTCAYTAYLGYLLIFTRSI